MVGIRSLPFGMVYFQVRTVGFRECTLLKTNTYPLQFVHFESMILFGACTACSSAILRSTLWDWHPRGGKLRNPYWNPMAIHWTTLPKTNSSPPKGNSSYNHQFSGAMLVSGRVNGLLNQFVKLEPLLVPWEKLLFKPFRSTLIPTG